MPERCSSPAISLLVPLELRVGGADIALVELIDEQPLIRVIAANGFNGLGDRYLRRNRDAYVAEKLLEIALLA